MDRSLIKPNAEFESSYREYIRELGDEERYPFPLDFDHSEFSSLLARLADFEAGRSLPVDYVASSTYWLVEAGEILGVSNLRHTLNEEIRRCGGHIGLGIRPSQRGRGLGAELMSLTIQEAKKRGIDEVHIHCYKSNPASAKIIAANGGVLHSEIEEGVSANVVQRFVVRAPGNGLRSGAGNAGAS
jgi:predicted acetyltransferase